MTMMRSASVAMMFALAASAHAAPGNDADELRGLIRAGAEACAAGEPEKIMTHYAKDISLAYPGAPDSNYDAIFDGYKQLCKGSGEGTVESTVPAFEEVVVAGDMAMVRIVWNTHLRGMAPGTTRQLRDMQIWRRGANGWEFFRGVHYPLKPRQ